VASCSSLTSFKPRRSLPRLGAIALVIALGAVPQAEAGSPDHPTPAVTEVPIEGLAPAEIARRQAREAEQDAERMRAERRAAARWLSFDAPFYSIENGLETTLFLMNTVTDPISVELEVRNDQGESLALGTFVIESLNHLEVSLGEKLAGFEDGFSSGSVRCSLLGDADTLQGWAVVSGSRGQTVEIPFTTAEDFVSSRLVGFWDLSQPAFGPSPRADLFLANVSEQTVHARITLGPGTSDNPLTVEVPPSRRLRVDGSRGAQGLGARGSVAVDHDGPPGALIGVAVAGVPTPVQTFELGDGDTTAGTARYESIPLPASAAVDSGPSAGSPTAGGPTAPWVTLFNGADAPQTVSIESLDATSGAVLDRSSVEVTPGAVRTVPLARLAALGTRNSPPVRLRVRGERSPLLVRGGVPLADGTTADVAFFPFEDAHGQGTYPLPDVDRYETVTTLVNLGDEDALIGVQVHWSGGTFALGPLMVPAHGLHKIDLEELADTVAPDVLGRRLDRGRPAGVLKWTVMKGSNALIGRTDVRPREGDDRFGFNCYGCCWENATASIVPSLVEFGPGDSRSFQSCITYNDCSGTMGPYSITPQSMTVPSPFSWNSSTITAPTAADDGMDFGVQFLETSPTCFSFLKWLLGYGRAEMCDFTFNPRDYDPRKTCTEQTSICLECKACCANLYQVKVCRGVDLDSRDGEFQACDTNCSIDICPS